MTHPLQRIPRRAGAAVLELALTAPFLLVLVGGIIELGTMMMRQEQVIQICREGVMWGAMTRQTDNPPAVAIARIRAALLSAGFNADSAVINAQLIDTTHGKGLTVDLVVTREPIIGFISSTNTFQSSASMRLEDM